MGECIHALRLAIFAPLIYEHFTDLAICDKILVYTLADIDEGEQLRTLGRKVEELKFEQVEDIEYVQWQELGCLKRLLAPLTRVKTLSIEWMPPHPDILASDAREDMLRIAQHVQTLAIGRSEWIDLAAFSDFLLLFPNLSSLRCSYIAVGCPEQPLRLRSLASLRISHAALSSVVHNMTLFRTFTLMLDPSILESLEFECDTVMGQQGDPFWQLFSRLHPRTITITMHGVPNSGPDTRTIEAINSAIGATSLSLP